MAEIAPNVPPKGESCNTCLFAITHTCGDDAARVRVKCARFPPTRRGALLDVGLTVEQREIDTMWPYTTVDDWCGEWEKRT